MKSIYLAVALALLLPIALAGAEEPAAEGGAKQAPSREQLEKDFSEALNNVTFKGHFTVTGQKSDAAPKEEMYTIERVTKVSGNTWLFQTRIQYGEHDLRLPLPLAVEWAGDTPVITLTDMTIPGLGKFTSRVVVYRGQYAGVWSGADHGGQLFGQITKNSEK